MKLFYFRGSCSFAPHLILKELGLRHELIDVNKDAANMDALIKVNSLGAVPVLTLDNGQSLTEVSAILQYLADLKPESGLAPKAGTFERVRLQEWLNFIATEIHKGFGPLFALSMMTSDAKAQEDIKQFTIEGLNERFDLISERMGTQEYLMATGYTVADAYLYTILNWAKYLKVDLSRWPKLLAHHNRIRARPATTATWKAESLQSESKV